MNTTIQISRENWEKLMKMRIKLKLKDHNTVLSKLFQLVTKFKLAKELEDLK